MPCSQAWKLTSGFPYSVLPLQPEQPRPHGSELEAKHTHSQSNLLDIKVFAQGHVGQDGARHLLAPVSKERSILIPKPSSRGYGPQRP